MWVSGSTVRRRSRSFSSRALAAGLLLIVGWSSVEILWARAEPSIAAAEAGASGADSGPQEDCPCFCACACQAVHVVLPTPHEPAPESVRPTFPAHRIAAAPPGHAPDPPFRPPRHVA